MDISVEPTIALLSHTPAALIALLRGLPETWTSHNEGENTWSVFEVVGHLIHGERTDWIPRAKRILEFGETKAFDPFDRAGHVREIEGKSLEQLLEEFDRARAESLAALRGLNPTKEDLDRRGTHPALGVVTLGQLLSAWAVHDLTHLHQIARVMAYQYRDAIGPWRKFMGVMQCSGHSAPA